MINGDVSFWYASLGGPPAPGEALGADLEFDVCIVGGGFTGLWTAYYLAKEDPSIRIVLLESEFCGFGASGRNGGFLGTGFPWSRERYASVHGKSAVAAMSDALFDCPDEILRVLAREDIDAEVGSRGSIMVAWSTPALRRLKEEFAVGRQWGVTDNQERFVEAKQLHNDYGLPTARGGLVTPAAARVNPAKMVRGLSSAVRAAGVTIFEGTPALQIVEQRVTTPHGSIRAPIILRCTEGFTAQFSGLKRRWLPMNSAMIATEPIPAEVWDEHLFRHTDLLDEYAHAFAYLQRTPDNRLLIGGRGVPYRYGSRVDTRGATDRRTVPLLVQAMQRLFPGLGPVRVDHAWCGVLAVPRDWCATVEFDASTGLGSAGGYVGAGVAASNLAGRTLRDLVLRKNSEFTDLPWVNHRARSWEPEPMRWIGANVVSTLYRLADQHESRSARTSPLAHLATRLAGRY